MSEIHKKSKQVNVKGRGIVSRDLGIEGWKGGQEAYLGTGFTLDVYEDGEVFGG